MEKRFQVFVSSTYADLKEERRRVIQTLLEMDCIPTGMELFPAVDEEQWDFIKRIINDCDYYIVIIGGRYGSTTAEGISYTEKEYDYVIERGIKVLGFLHENPDDISVGKSDIDPVIRERLTKFRDKVAGNRLVKFWNRAEDLPGLVALSLQKTMKMYPSVGWVRADRASSEDLLNEINDIRKEYQKLKESNDILIGENKVEITGIASIDDSVVVTGTYTHPGFRDSRTWGLNIKWEDIFGIIAPYLLKYPTDEYVKTVYDRELSNLAGIHGRFVEINDHDFHTIKIQLLAHKLINVAYTKTVTGGMGLFWSLTEKGNILMMQLRTIKTKGPA